MTCSELIVTRRAIAPRRNINAIVAYSKRPAALSLGEIKGISISLSNAHRLNELEIAIRKRCIRAHPRGRAA